MSDFFDKDGFPVDEPQWKTIEELIREIREEKEAAGELKEESAGEALNEAAGEEINEAAGQDSDGVNDPAAEPEAPAEPVEEPVDTAAEPEAPAEAAGEPPEPMDEELADEELDGDEQSYYMDLDWDKVNDLSNRQLAGSELSWELEEEEETVPQPTLADLDLHDEEAGPEEPAADQEPEQEIGGGPEPATDQEPAEEAEEKAAPAAETAEPAAPENETAKAAEPAAEAVKAAAPENETAKAAAPAAAAIAPDKDSGKDKPEQEADAAQAKQKRRWAVHPVSLLITALLLAALFIGVFRISYPVDYDNLGGTHSWLSATTLTFVNNWLDEGPQALHFTNYNGRYSVEYRDLADRDAYVSYPTGTTLFVYSAAKLTGKEHIDISFLKHFQMVWYLVEAILLAWFAMLLTAGSGYRSASGKVVIGFMTGAIWILMPVNVWYLSNVYFADQCVILWVMLFLPIEYMIRVKEKGGWINGEDIQALSRAENRKRLRDGRAPFALYVLRFIIIYTGMLIDYYFWLLVFMAFFTEFIGDLLNKRGLGRAVSRSMGYVIPVLAALLTFRWQVSGVENWRKLLYDRFVFRTTDDIAGLEEVRGFFRSTFTADSEEMMQWMIYYNLAILVLGIVYLLFHRGPGRLFKSSQCSILVTAFGAIVFHVLLLKQHSGVHEFSQIKVSWWIAMMPVVSAILVLKILAPERRKTGASRNPTLSWLMLLFMLTFSATLYITQIPSVDRAYYQFRNQQESYPIEEAIRDYTGYRDVCFSFTYEIPQTPPQKLAVAGKKVYHIDNLDEISDMFPDLWMDNGRLLMVMEKSTDELTPEQNEVLYAIFDPEAVVVENSSCTIFEIPDWRGMI